ncbi:hypothetical protein [Streptomyces antimycoticus]|uniref:hypothetical protein n=1 Tax=Streptomyces antimycoticus TaxID=68175 RepID=UPI00386B1D86|nr:hypothetical protein OG751_04120 [Streptomyces antimycoticus]
MTNYSDPNTPLTAKQYAWTATFVCGPLEYGSNASQDCAGTCTPRPGATVGSLLEYLTTWYAKSKDVPVTGVTLVSYSLREK